jgi:hypothetical protein
MMAVIEKIVRRLTRGTLLDSEVEARITRARSERLSQREEIQDKAVRIFTRGNARLKSGLFLTQKELDRQRDEFIGRFEKKQSGK